MTGSLTWEERNLLVLLDPGNVIPVERWEFIRSSADRFTFSKELLLFTFPRKRFLHYLLISLLFRCYGRGKETVKVFKFQDGMTSTLFHAGNALAYSSFVRSHATRRRTWREKIKSLLPPVINAERRYLAVGRELTQLQGEKAFDRLTFMFYSNESGKLILTEPDTFITGRGQLVVTTANGDYHPVLNKEFSMLEQMGKARLRLVPNLVDKLHVNGRPLFVEEYVAGTTLRETLRNTRVATDREMVAGFIDRLDAWFVEYRKLYSGRRIPVSELYRSPLETFAGFHPGNPRLERFLQALRVQLAGMDGSHSGLVPITAHNDLWPGNFIVSGKSLVAIDWERATFDRSEFFDYFWMLISAYLEYHIGRTGVEEYSLSFRSFVAGGDSIGTLVREKLCVRLEINGIDRRHYDLFLALFLLEWSIQGHKALGYQTRMDMVAMGELLHYLEHGRDRFDTE